MERKGRLPLLERCLLALFAAIVIVFVVDLWLRDNVLRPQVLEVMAADAAESMRSLAPQQSEHAAAYFGDWQFANDCVECFDPRYLSEFERVYLIKTEPASTTLSYFVVQEACSRADEICLSGNGGSYELQPVDRATVASVIDESVRRSRRTCVDHRLFLSQATVCTELRDFDGFIASVKHEARIVGGFPPATQVVGVLTTSAYLGRCEYRLMDGPVSLDGVACEAGR